MRLRRLSVEEGFLHGLSLEFVPGLNVLIGPRGVGKTSVIELVRFCLAVPAYTTENDRMAREHALSVLRGGRVTLEIEHDGAEYQVTRTADDELDSLPVLDSRPIILAQNEIEKIGLDAGGRLRLIDDFLSGLDEIESKESLVLSEIASMTQRLESVAEAAAKQDDEIRVREGFEEELKQTEADQEGALKKFSDLEPERDALDKLDRQLVELQGQLAEVEGSSKEAERWTANLAELARESEELLPPVTKGKSLQGVFAPASKELQEIQGQLANVSATADRFMQRLVAAREDLRKKHSTVDEEGRALRSKLEAAQAGAGALSRRITALRQQVGALQAAREKRSQLLSAVEAQQEQRHSLLDELDRLRGSRFEMRREVAQSLSAALSPQVKVGVVRYGEVGPYSDAIAGALRGSNLRYGTLAPQLAQRMTPRELAEAVERGDAEGLASATNIAADRAARVIEQLRSGGLEPILRAPVDDAVSLSLLDGSDYKASGQLSTGQRCTTILPILLAHKERVLVIDQPEDHLDNAYIAETVVRSLRETPPNSQLVVSTHNANIPVLGDASRVTLLNSDGQRGFVRCAGDLVEPEIVGAITSVMEGGEEAFRKRAEFYKEHPSG